MTCLGELCVNLMYIFFKSSLFRKTSLAISRIFYDILGMISCDDFVYVPWSVMHGDIGSPISVSLWPPLSAVHMLPAITLCGYVHTRTLLTHLPQTKWSPFRIFIHIFINEKFCCFFIQISLKFVSLTKVSVGSSNGLAPNRRQAIIWTNTDPVHWRIYAALGDELMLSARI